MFNKEKFLALCNEWSKNTLMETLEIEYIDAGEDFLKAKMPVNSRVHQPMGLLHGGATVALAESVGSAASLMFINPEKQEVRGIEISANHLRSNSGMQYKHSVKSTVEGAQNKMDVALAACAAVLKDQSANRLIHGHTHLPAHHQESMHDQAWQRWVLSDWDLDHPVSERPRASALMINEYGVSYTDLIKN